MHDDKREQRGCGSAGQTANGAPGERGFNDVRMHFRAGHEPAGAREERRGEQIGLRASHIRRCFDIRPMMTI